MRMPIWLGGMGPKEWEAKVRLEEYAAADRELRARGAGPLLTRDEAEALSDACWDAREQDRADREAER